MAAPVVGELLAVGLSELIKLVGTQMARAKQVLPAAEYNRLVAEQRAAIGTEAAEEAAWTPVEGPEAGA